MLFIIGWQCVILCLLSQQMATYQVLLLTVKYLANWRKNGDLNAQSQSHLL